MIINSSAEKQTLPPIPGNAQNQKQSSTLSTLKAMGKSIKMESFHGGGSGATLTIKNTNGHHHGAHRPLSMSWKDNMSNNSGEY
jgi:hypothetical protein